MQSLHTAKLGLRIQQQRMDVIASNIANVSTNGYKCETVRFKDALYTQMIDPANVASTENLKKGSGVLLSSTGRDFTLGTPVETGQPLDLYIDGDGFFTVKTSDGSIMYTRGSSFGLSNEADGKYITTADGSYLLDSTGNRIRLTVNPEDVSVSGTQLIANGTVFANLQLVTFTNKDGLSLTGSGSYTPTVASGQLKASSAGIKQGYIESSNVDISAEFTQLIRAQRTFSLAGKALNAWNDMESTTNNLRT